jgi:PHS family inorganic phosphate transporter-like MFS transporter
LLNKASSINALEEMYHLSKAMSLIALVAIVPGYWFTVFFIDRIGRFIIQLGGFLLMSIFMAILGFKYGDRSGEKKACGPDSNEDFL